MQEAKNNICKKNIVFSNKDVYYICVERTIPGIPRFALKLYSENYTIAFPKDKEF